MATITFKGNPIHTAGTLPAVGTVCPDFKLTGSDLSDVTLANFAGKKKVLNIVPSLDTGVCQASARRFNAEAAARPDTVVINISADLPFAQKRFCDSEKLDRVVNLSTMRSPDFGKVFGVAIVDGPLAGLMSRAVLVLNKDNIVVHAQQVPEIVQEPDYAQVLAALDKT
ncbi:MAG: thiol peroxidase [Kiritimatiellae bacterium]|nr:thiol peroxidase [Kiritimatiellia bacterium]MDW8457799.1 thiol peroxidase [Verrucomicrobiota bacterium]